MNVLTIDEKKVFQCLTCGLRPNVLVIDCIANGLMKSELKKHKEKIVQEMECESKMVLKGSNLRDRMFIKLQKNQTLIKEAAKAKDWPKTKDGD